MSELAWAAVIVIVGLLLVKLNHRWQRKRRAAKLADELLKDVLKHKDAFRR